ncbi:hypothetical protein ACHAXS_000805 [Conticribra weissflogii]
MCIFKTRSVRTKQSTSKLSKSQSLSKQYKHSIRTSSISISLPKQQISSSKQSNTQDMFEVYSTQGLVAHELEAFGFTSRPFDSQKKNNRKSRVSTEIHPDLLFAEFLLE